MLRFLSLGWLTIGSLLVSCSHANAQYSLTATPYQNANYGYSENFNLAWGIQGRGFGFNWNGGNANPPFGPFDPNAQAQLGGGFQAGPLSGGFRLTAGQGADSTLVSQTPSVTVMNGGTGYFSDTTQRPFVTSITPVIGNAYYTQPAAAPSYYASPLQERLARLKAQKEQGSTSTATTATTTNQPAGNGGGNLGPSSAERGTASIADIRAGQAAAEDAKQQEITDLLTKAQAFEAAGKTVVAKNFYQQAARRAVGPQRAEILAHIKALD